MNALDFLSQENVKLDFSITDPRRSFAGHTVYRVNCNAQVRTHFVRTVRLRLSKYEEQFKNNTRLDFHSESNKGTDNGEVILWRRYSEFRRLHRDLKAIFEKQSHNDHFPDFAGPKLFGRFDDQVIEDRRQSAAKLLDFIAERSQLWSSQSFRKFVQTPLNSSGPNRPPSVTSESTDEQHEDTNNQDGDSSTSPSSINNDVRGNQLQNTSEGTWGHRQPTPDLLEDRPEDNAPQEPRMVGHPSPTDLQDRSMDEHVGSTLPDSITLEEKDQSLSGDNGAGNVFTEIGVEAAEDNSEDVFDGDEDPVTRQREWLKHAFSICSEGEDIERLASEAEDNFPMPSPNPSPQTNSSSGVFFKEEGDTGKDSNDCADSRSQSTLSLDARPQPNFEPDEGTEFQVETESSSSMARCGSADQSAPQIIECNSLESVNAEGEAEETASDPAKHSDAGGEILSITASSEMKDSNRILPDTMSSITCPDFTIGKAMSEVIEEVVGEDDYIYQASLAMSEATEYETIGDFGSAFQLYKFGVGVLLHGVQQDENSSRREAVRRKTAQYLLKAETLYQNYLARKDTTINTQDSSTTLPRRTLATELKQSFSLKDLQVIGTVDKVMLVEDIRTGEEFIMKVLHKCGAEYKHDRNKSKSSKPPLLYNYKNSVRLISYMETWTGIYLLLEHIPSGRLWDHLGLKLEYSRPVLASGLTHSDNQSGLFYKKRPSYSKRSSRLARDDFDTDISDAVQSAFDDCNISPSRQTGYYFGVPGRSFGKPVRRSRTNEDWLPENEVKRIAAQLVVAIESLHSHGIICKDLNPRNVLIDSNGQIILTYFSGVADVDYILDEEATGKQYAAPEVDGVFHVTKAADWWSFGALLFELLTAKSLISCHPGGIHSHSIITLPRAVSRCALALLSELLRYNPKDRLGSGPTGAEEIKAHPFFAGIPWEDYSR